MQIRKIDLNNQADKKKFSQFPFELYKESPYWVPPFSSEMKLVLDRSKHPFYSHSQADFFVAESEGQILGTIAALQNNNYCAHHNIQIGFFFYFECVNDLQVSQGLFDAANHWAKNRNLTSIRGPRGFLRSDSVGCLIEGFDYSPAIGIGYNHPYYQRLIENYGFLKLTDHLSGYMDQSQRFPDKVYEVAEKVKQRGNFWIKSFSSKAEMKQFIPVVDKVHHEAFKNNPGYYPSTSEEFNLLARNLIQLFDPRLVKAIMKGDDIAGFIICYPDFSNAIREIKGEMYPFGWISVLREMKKTRKINVNGVGLLPQYQGLGGNALLYTELEKTIREFKYETAEIIQVDENNFKSRSDMETMGVSWVKRHRSYSLDISK